MTPTPTPAAGAAGRSRAACPGRQPHVPERRCIACGRRAPQADLVRLRLEKGADESGRPPRVVVDREPVRRGRGAYLCPRRVCLDQAVRRRAFQRAFRTSVTVDETELAKILEERMDEAT